MSLDGTHLYFCLTAGQRKIASASILKNTKAVVLDERRQAFKNRPLAKITHIVVDNNTRREEGVDPAWLYEDSLCKLISCSLEALRSALPSIKVVSYSWVVRIMESKFKGAIDPEQFLIAVRERPVEEEKKEKRRHEIDMEKTSKRARTDSTPNTGLETGTEIDLSLLSTEAKQVLVGLDGDTRVQSASMKAEARAAQSSAKGGWRHVLSHYVSSSPNPNPKDAPSSSSSSSATGSLAETETTVDSSVDVDTTVDVVVPESVPSLPLDISVDVDTTVNNEEVNQDQVNQASPYPPYHPYPSIVLFRQREQGLFAIRDVYPKSRIHLLLVPDPSMYGQVPLLSSLRQSHLPLLRNMQTLSIQISHFLGNCGYGWFPPGFHSTPSLQPLHLHLLTRDLDSPFLKNKKHWNSFARYPQVSYSPITHCMYIYILYTYIHTYLHVHTRTIILIHTPI